MIVYGCPSTGKSWLVEYLRSKGIICVDTDDLFDAFGVDWDTWSNEVNNNSVFSKMMYAMVHVTVIALDTLGITIITNIKTKKRDYAFDRPDKDSIVRSSKDKDFSKFKWLDRYKPDQDSFILPDGKYMGDFVVVKGDKVAFSVGRERNKGRVSPKTFS